jgi:thiamine pyrophosphate-dependent acetolactate synthase large subunit-like protein
MADRTTLGPADYFETLLEHWQDEIVVCSLGTTSDEWWTRTRSDKCFYVNAAMGFASSLALGIALNCPGERVWMLDSDGALAMNLGGLLTEASLQPENYVHIVLNNRSYGCLGGAELVNATQSDYAAIAAGAGMRNAVTASSREELDAALRAAENRHSFIVADVQQSADLHGFEPPISVSIDGPEAKYSIGRHLEQRLGRPVFGPNGY